MKKILSILVFAFALVCVLTSCNLPFWPSEETKPQESFTTSQGLVYRINKDGKTCTIVGYNNPVAREITIENYIDGYKVTAIWSSAFSGCSNLMSVTIPDSVTTIDMNAFMDCDNLKSVTIPDSVTTIGSSAFSGCYNLTSVTIGDSVTTIGNSAFRGCYNLTSVTIGDSVTSIGDDAFGGCHKLVEVVNKSSLTITKSSSNHGRVAYYAKEVHNGATKITNQDNYLFYTYNGVNYLLGYVGADVVLILPESYKGQNYEIYQNAFYNCSYLTSVTIGDSVTTIGECAFCDCRNLISVTIGNSVTSIDSGAFCRCHNLMSVTIGDSVTTINEMAFNDCRKLVEVINKSSLIITAGASNNGEVACNAKEVHSGATKLVNLEDYLFYTYDDVNYLLGYVGADTILTLPEDYNKQKYEIYPHAFDNCNNLTSVTIPNSVTAIGAMAFYDCRGLTSVTIPNSVTTVGVGAFGGSNGLIYNWYDGGDGVYLGNKAEPYLVLVKLSTNMNSCQIHPETKIIAGGASSLCENLTNVTIPDSVTTIGDRAFEYCHNLTSVTIPDSVTTIGDQAFEGCYNLTCVTIPDSVTTIGDRAFDGCSNLTSVTIGDSVTTIGDRAFNGCSNLTSVTIPDSVTTIGYEVFRYCDNLMYTEYKNAHYLGNETNPYIYLAKATSTDIVSWPGDLPEKYVLCPQ